MIRCYVTDRNQVDVLEAARRAIEDGIDMIQIREKNLDTTYLLNLVRSIAKLADGSKTQILVNDRLDVALTAAIPGVHLPANGLPASEVRPLVDLLGVSTHTLQEAVHAERAGANFIVFGPVFETPGKKPVGIGRLKQACSAVSIPVLAIGGINKENTPLVMEAGASGIAAIRLFQG